MAAQATEAIAAVHRRPAALRQPDVLVSESALRGARTSTLIDGHQAPVDEEPAGAFGHAVSTFGLLSPGSIQRNAATFRRSPAQIIARLDVLAGGDGIPADGGAQRLRVLAQVIGAPDVDAALLPQIVHAEIAAQGILGPRSGVVARAASRLAAVATGFDPRGLAVPEIHLNSRRGDYQRVLGAWSDGSAESIEEALGLLLRSWIAGAAEAEAIVRAA